MTVVQLATASRWVGNLNGKLQNSNSDIWGNPDPGRACQTLTSVQSHSLIQLSQHPDEIDQNFLQPGCDDDYTMSQKHSLGHILLGPRLLGPFWVSLIKALQ